MSTDEVSTSGRAKDAGLDGLRGLAAMAVFFSHALFGFFPFTQTGETGQRRHPWEQVLFDSPLHILYSGGFAVSLFFVLSGYVLSKRFFEGADIDYLRGAAVKRYFRLGIPVAAATMVGYVLMLVHAFHRVSPALPISFVWGSYRGEHSLSQALAEAIYGSLLMGRTGYDYVLWTIQVEFYGSILLFAFLALLGRFRYAGAAAAITVLCLAQLPGSFGSYIAMFIVGAYIGRLPALFRTKAFAVSAIVLGIYLAGYKSGSYSYQPLFVLANGIQGHLGLDWNWPLLFELVGAWLLVAGIVASPRAHAMLAIRPISWLGRVSFTVYLIHTLVLGSLGAAVFKELSRRTSYEASAVVAILLSLVVTLVLAEPFRRLFDEPAIGIANRVGKWATRQVDPQHASATVATSNNPSIDPTSAIRRSRGNSAVTH